MSTIPLSPDSRIALFVSSTGKVHKAASYRWGIGMACSDAFTTGESTEGPVSAIDCARCIAHDLPDTWEIRIPDKRYNTGYRVASSGIASEDEANVMVQRIKDEPNYNGAEPYAVSVPPLEDDDE